MTTPSTIHNVTFPGGVRLIARNVQHPDNPTVWGDLCQYERTGVYVILCGGGSSSVPQGWARALDADMRDRNKHRSEP
jgi:hypothetical protein